MGTIRIHERSGKARPGSAASLQCVPQPADRTGPPRRETAILSDAGFWRVSFSSAFLPRFRGSSAILSTPPQAEPGDLTSPRQTAVSVPSPRIGIAVRGCVTSTAYPTNQRASSFDAASPDSLLPNRSRTLNLYPAQHGVVVNTFRFSSRAFKQIEYPDHTGCCP